MSDDRTEVEPMIPTTTPAMWNGSEGAAARHPGHRREGDRTRADGLLRRGAGAAVWLAVAWLTSGVQAAEEEATVEVSGQVVQEGSGDGLDGVKLFGYVQRQGSALERRSLTTDSEGKFDVTVPQGSTLILYWDFANNATRYLLDLDWLQDAGGGMLRLVADRDRSDIRLEFRLLPSASLGGVVRDAEGAPASGVEVKYPVRSGTSTVTATTGDDGSFELKPVPADREFEVVAEAPDGTGFTTARVYDIKKRIEITLAATQGFDGQVVSDQKKPATGFQFILAPHVNGEAYRLKQVRCTTDAEGRFRADGLSPSVTYVAVWSYYSSMSNREYVDGETLIVPESGRPLRIEVQHFDDNWQASGNIAVSEETKCGKLSNYCLDHRDNVLACDEAQQVVRVISPDDRLLAIWKPGFPPQAIAATQHGEVVVAGAGKVARLDASGKVLASGEVPVTVATGMAWSGKDIFVAGRSGTSYTIHRLGLDLKAPHRIVEGLRGCCGQLDIDARDGRVYVAANCRFKVLVYDRDGKEVHSFGKRGRSGDESFKGCCEPKNVVVGRYGFIYTAESEECCVKRFTLDGEYVDTLGRVNGIRGCVRVTIAVNRAATKIYMLDTGRNIIRFLVPKIPILAHGTTAEESGGSRRPQGALSF